MIRCCDREFGGAAEALSDHEAKKARRQEGWSEAAVAALSRHNIPLRLTGRDSANALTARLRVAGHERLFLCRDP